MRRFKQQCEQGTRRNTCKNAEQDGKWNARKIGGGGGAALGDVAERGKKDDDEHIIQRCTGKDQLWNTFLRSKPILHKLYHFGDNHGRRNGRRHRAHKGGFDR